jgi:hypothetical protein
VAVPAPTVDAGPLPAREPRDDAVALGAVTPVLSTPEAAAFGADSPEFPAGTPLPAPTPLTVVPQPASSAPTTAVNAQRMVIGGAESQFAQ